ncbi:MAG: response regulator [Magnetococcales bacterium]|nr:response regulator [Magnetococcales bacterium]
MATIMVVDDAPETRIFLDALLCQEGHHVVLSADGQEALNFLDDNTYDLILMDIQMPIMDGYQATQQIKARMRPGENVPVIFLTSVQTDRELARCLECGGDDFLNKPPSPILLKARIQFWLQRAEMANRLEQSHAELKTANQCLTSLNIKLMEAEKLQQDVDRIVRHDLKTPLNSIIGYSDLLLSDKNISSSQRENIEIIYNSSINVLHMINLSLGLYQMERGEYTCKMEEIDLLAILRNIRVQLGPSLFGTGLTIKIIMHDRDADESDQFMVQAETVLCYSMLSNLIKNAVEASPSDQVVTITLVENENFSHIVIHNRGAVPTAMRDRFFEKYATCGKMGGTGLGTYSAKLIAKTLGGDIQMRSSDDTGTELIVSFRKGTLPTGHETADSLESTDFQPEPGKIVEAVTSPLPPAMPVNRGMKVAGSDSVRFGEQAPQYVNDLRIALADQNVHRALIEIERLYQAASEVSAKRVMTQAIRLKGIVEMCDWVNSQEEYDVLERNIQLVLLKNHS